MLQLLWMMLVVVVGLVVAGVLLFGRCEAHVDFNALLFVCNVCRLAFRLLFACDPNETRCKRVRCA